MPNKEQNQSTSKSDLGDGPNKVRETAEQLRSSAVERVESVRNTAEEAKQRAAERVRKLGGAVRKIGEHMRVEEQFYIADRANDACQRLDAVADYIDQSELSMMLRDAGDVARKRPGMVFGGTFLLGLAVGRFLKLPEGGAATRTPKREIKGPEPAARQVKAPEPTARQLKTPESSGAPR